MFSVCTFTCSGRSQYEEIRSKTSVAAVLDVALFLIFSILGTLGTSGVLPLGVGITFDVFAVLQGLVFVAARKLCTQSPQHL